MKVLLIFLMMLVLCCSLCVACAAGETVYEEGYPKGSVVGDAIAGTPALSPRGEHAIGVRTITAVNPGQVNLAAITKENPRPLYDRPLTMEVWYPAVAENGAKQLCEYTDHMGRVDQGDLRPVTYAGRAMRDSRPDTENGPYPVIIVSHGYPGSRMLMSYLGENLATKGYVVISVGHTDNTYTDFTPAISLLSAVINRTLDQRFTASSVQTWNQEGWMRGLLKPESVGLIGYSFGGFGALRTLGIRLSDETVDSLRPYADLLIEEEAYRGDVNVRAAVLFAPYGRAMFAESSFENIHVPTLWIQGDTDITVGYDGVREMYEKALNSERYMLTYALMNHHVATNPAPIQSQAAGWTDANRWADGVWDTWRVNGINCHFITAFMDAYLKGETDKLEYFNVKEPSGRKAVYSVDAEGRATDKHTYWPGFLNKTLDGLTLDHLSP